MQVSDAKSIVQKKSEWDTLGEDLGKVQPEQEYFSVCDVWKDGVHKLVTKLEYQTPIYLQAYTQVHTEFLHGIDNLFGTCYLWQKQYFDRLGISKGVLDAYGKLCNSWVERTTESLDMYANYSRMQADMVIDAMKVGNNVLQSWVEMYGKMVTFWNFSSR